jgi:pimeloyl-ACP methyl ester carboxylesterase
VRNPVVLGHSWGTLVAVALALQSNYAVSEHFHGFDLRSRRKYA